MPHMIYWYMVDAITLSMRVGNGDGRSIARSSVLWEIHGSWVIRCRNKPRRAQFTPFGCRCPVDPSILDPRRLTVAWWGGKDYGVAPDLVDQDAWEDRTEAYRKLDQPWRGYSCFNIMDETAVLPGELPQRIEEDLDEDLRDPNVEVPEDDWL